MSILVTGSTGNVGSIVLNNLIAQKISVKAASRNPADYNFPDGVKSVRLDFKDQSTFDGALESVDKVFLCIRSDSIELFVKAAKIAGVKLIVLLSSLTVAFSEDDGVIRKMHVDAENFIINSGIPYVFLRPGVFSANSKQLAKQIKSGVVRGAYAKSTNPRIHERDIAEVAVAALTTPELVGTAPALTGEQPISHEEVVAIIASELGKPIKFEEITEAEAVVEMSANGFPEVIVKSLLSYEKKNLGKEPFVSGEVARILGKPARTFQEWVRDHISEFK
ncbi:hypothetical protein HK096_003351 [Nowakowskiella sp. JEL0078]|nr:hypothetical protein HK096_003351 [Nowakowskiella sp. JEL0078]